MREDIKEVKKRVSEEWLNFIPQTSLFAQNKFYKIVGCSIIGIELIKLPKVEEYRPHFVLYPLWKLDLKDCFDSPIILMEISNKKGLQFSIPYFKHSNCFNEAIECLKKQVPILFKENVTLNSLFDLVDTRFSDVLVKSNSAQQAKLFELKFFIALYNGNQSQIQNVLSQIQKASKGWNMLMFEMWYGKYDLWFQTLQEKVNSRDFFLNQVEINKKNKKISQFKSLEIR